MPAGKVEGSNGSPVTAGRRRGLRRLAKLVVVLAALAGIVVLLRHAGSFLVIHAPRRSDVIVVLGGGAGSSRYAQAVKLQSQGYAARVLLDADVTRAFFDKTEADMVEDYLRRTRQEHTEVCPTVADSTYGEAADVERCLVRLGARSALIVTSDFHTRRALEIFQKRLPQYSWSVAASSWPANAAEQYWKHRAWAKTVFDEWQKYLWWKLVDQWRKDVVLG